MLDIPGLICEADAQSLTRLVQSVLTVPGCLLEVGCHLGLSTATILAANTTQKAVHCLDLFHAFDEWKENVSPFIGKGVLVDTVKGDIMDTLKTWPHGPIAFAFIDHNHRLDTTVRCYEVMWPHVSIGESWRFTITITRITRNQNHSSTACPMNSRRNATE